MQINGGFRAAYRELEARMKALAEAEGDVFLPNPEPDGPVDYVLICMEPSLGRSPNEVTSSVAEGARNFLSSIEDFILHLCVRRYLCGSTKRYHITDLSKGAMLVERAGLARVQRYDWWYGLLEEEMNLVGTADASIVAVGKVVAEHLERRGFSRPITRIIHYSGQAARARSEGIAGYEHRFRAFAGSVSLEDLIATAEDVLTASRAPTNIRSETLSRLAKRQLSTSRQQLIFNYKLAVESM